MLIRDAQTFVGQFVQLSWLERSGAVTTKTAEVFDVTFVPLCGPCMVTDVGDIRLDRVRDVKRVRQQLAA